ncbi:MAG: hypothetical protein ACT4O1_05145, partial [Gemmatimonadota bacterium]
MTNLKARSALFGAFLLLLSGCGDSGLFSPNTRGPTRLSLRPYFSVVNGSSSAADINRIRLTIRERPALTLIKQEIVDVATTDNSWNVDLEVPPNSELQIVIELINVGPTGERVDFSGIVEVSVTTGPQPPTPPVPVFPGGPENLAITNVVIAPRDQDLLEGDVVDLNATATGGP